MKAMNAKNGLPMRWLVTACALAMVLTLPQAGVAQQAPAAGAAKPDASKLESVPLSSLMPGAAPARPAAKPNAEEEESPQPDSAGHQGIKVHGHWVLDIRNPDGTLAKHLDFQNSLTTGAGSGTTAFPTGDQLLAALLSGTAVISDPGILFVGFSPGLAAFPANSDITNYCFTNNNSFCDWLTTPQSTLNFSNANLQQGLTATVNFSPAVSWVLTGNWTVPSGMTSLTAVQTWLPVCVYNVNLNHNSNGGYAFSGSSSDRTSSTLTMAGCTSQTIDGSAAGDASYQQTNFGPLTSTVVPGAPQALTTGQIVTVKVTISFS